MAKHAGAYRGDKRRKEIARQKKQEEKRLRRLNKSKGTGAQETEEMPAENLSGEGAETESAAGENTEAGNTEPS